MMKDGKVLNGVITAKVSISNSLDVGCGGLMLSPTNFICGKELIEL
jgi:hypothetical protein